MSNTRTSSSGATPDQDVVALVDEIVRRALVKGASDIHLEPKRERTLIRLRVDGAMVEEAYLAADIAQQVVSRVKVLARMDIAERRMPQDGQLTVETGPNNRVHLRASSFPCLFGEKIVLRLLLGQELIGFDQLGLLPATASRLREILRRPQGFIVTSGPTGSGKTSTLYSFLQVLETARVNVMTLEDPVEVDVPSITQGQTNVRAGFTFATGLRAILRQDPDVILVGEIRDAETASIALQASLTGHMVMTTLHTASSVETIVRLVDLGMEPWVVANALSAVIAQRLVRIVCPMCRDTAKLEHDLWDGEEVLLPAGSAMVRPRGCNACFRTGYKGRGAIFEVLVVDDDLRDLVKAKAAPREYRAWLAARNTPSLRRAGFEKVRAGVTTVDEVMRVTTS
ncbi:MAG TPA: GspE/PulE family protein [Polyangiaceae bacterium]|jgi:general secretion pathway protein E/type IV pilus assembly protein PilB